MNENYIVTNEYLSQRGLNLNDYAIDGTMINAIINLGLDLLVTRICYLNDSFQFESDIEDAISENLKLLDPFKKLQYRVIYNLIFQNEESPVDLFVDTIITQQLRWGKINGFQKGLYYRHN